jgi:plasmid maintenance system antidote protein VapI
LGKSADNTVEINTESIAVKLEELLDIPAEYWMQVQVS